MLFIFCFNLAFSNRKQVINSASYIPFEKNKIQSSNMQSATRVENKEKAVAEDTKKILKNKRVMEQVDTKKSQIMVSININTADISELIKLEGIGEKTAKKIIDYREKHGKFNSKQDIIRVSGIGDKKYKKIESYIYVK